MLRRDAVIFKDAGKELAPLAMQPLRSPFISTMSKRAGIAYHESGQGPFLKYPRLYSWRFSVIISIEAIESLFGKNNSVDQCVSTDKCQFCGCEVEVSITKTSGGYGLNGGVLYELHSGSFWVLCEKCHLTSDLMDGANKSIITDAA